MKLRICVIAVNLFIIGMCRLCFRFFSSRKCQKADWAKHRLVCNSLKIKTKSNGGVENDVVLNPGINIKSANELNNINNYAIRFYLSYSLNQKIQRLNQI
jgi:hypothetical protein